MKQLIISVMKNLSTGALEFPETVILLQCYMPSYFFFPSFNWEDKSASYINKWNPISLLFVLFFMWKYFINHIALYKC